MRIQKILFSLKDPELVYFPHSIEKLTNLPQPLPRGVGRAPRAPHNFTPTLKRLGIYYLAGVLCRGSLKGSGGAHDP